MSNKGIIIICLTLLAVMINSTLVTTVKAQTSPTTYSASYAEILSHSVQVAGNILMRWGILGGDAWELLDKARSLIVSISEVEGSDRELARKYFQEGMNYVHSAISLAAREYVGSEEFRNMVMVRKGLQEVQILNETINNVKSKLLSLNRSAALQTSVVNAYLTTIDNLIARVNSLKDYLNGVYSNLSNFNDKYVASELAGIGEQIRVLSRELSSAQLIKVRDEVTTRVKERLRDFEGRVDELRRMGEDIRAWGMLEVSRIVGMRIRGLDENISRLWQLISKLEGLDNLECLRELSNINEVLNVLNLSIDDLNNVLKEVFEVRDVISGEIARIREVSARLGLRLKEDGRLPQHVRERIAEMVRMSGQILNESDDVMKNLMTNTSSTDALLERFEAMVRDSWRYSQELRRSLGMHDQHRDIIPLVDDVEKSLDGMLRKVSMFNGVARKIRDDKKVYVEKLITTSMKTLEGLNLLKADPAAKKLLNDTLTLLREALTDLSDKDFKAAMKSLKLALNNAEELSNRLPYPHNLRISSLVGYLRLTLNELQSLS